MVVPKVKGKKIQLSVYLTKYNATKKYGGVEL
jgi:hypothetical protein